MIPHIHDIDGPVRLIHRDAAGEIELPVSVPEPPPGNKHLASHIELLDAEVGAINDIDVATPPIDRNAPGRIELPLAIPPRSKLHEIPAKPAIELLHAVIVGIHNPHVALAVAGHSTGIVEV